MTNRCTVIILYVDWYVVLNLQFSYIKCIRVVRLSCSLLLIGECIIQVIPWRLFYWLINSLPGITNSQNLPLKRLFVVGIFAFLHRHTFYFPPLIVNIYYLQMVLRSYYFFCITFNGSNIPTIQLKLYYKISMYVRFHGLEYFYNPIFSSDIRFLVIRLILLFPQLWNALTWLLCNILDYRYSPTTVKILLLLHYRIDCIVILISPQLALL